MAKNKVLICPYCGDTQSAGERCRACGGLFEPLSRQATHNAMGPWFLRDPNRPFQPGCSYETIVKLIERGQITKYNIVRGPTTKQFWTVARRVPGLSHLLGYCHNCDASVDSSDHGCHACGVPFGAYLDRNFLGLPDVRPLPWEAEVDEHRGGRIGGPRSIDFRRAAEPLGISSFASDEELRGVANAPGALPIAPHSREASFSNLPSNRGDVAEPVPHSHQASADPSRPSASVNPSEVVPSATTDAAAIRAMQRRMAQQQHTIRMLGLVALALGMICVVTLIAVLARGTSQSNQESLSATKPSPVDASNSDVKSPALNRTESSATERGADSPAESSPPTGPERPDYTEELARADELAAHAEATDRALSDRIADLEEAIKTYKRIASQIPADQQPADLAGRINKAERDLERLRLQEFFP